MDKVLWGYGQDVARIRGHLKHPWELDVLRGMHQQKALDALAVHLSRSTRSAIRLTSIWLDKQVWVTWKDAQGKTQTGKELADLAVVVRRKDGRNIHRWMWIAQAKSLAAMLDPYKGPSATNEIDLLHRMPRFELANVARAFDLQTDFHSPAIVGAPWNRRALVPWTFLDFDQNPWDPASATQGGISPIAARWPAKLPAASDWAAQSMSKSGLAGLGLASYTECLESIINNRSVNWHQSPSVQSQMIPGAPIHNLYPEWTRLYYHLLHQNRAATNGHASVTRGGKEDVIHVSQMVTDLYSRNFVGGGNYPWDWPEGYLPLEYFLHYKATLANYLNVDTSDFACSFSGWGVSKQKLKTFDEICRISEPGAPGDIPPINVSYNFDREPEGQMQFLIVDVIDSD